MATKSKRVGKKTGQSRRRSGLVSGFGKVFEVKPIFATPSTAPVFQGAIQLFTVTLEKPLPEPDTYTVTPISSSVSNPALIVKIVTDSMPIPVGQSSFDFKAYVATTGTGRVDLEIEETVSHTKCAATL